ncbi:MAG: phosphoribosylaminoimidazolecarboxamide formyltransferase/IMP cyclohydrolase [Bradymonadia bacterium]|jgi:phosphoribosylaminoimidazolecarboxamide formyltransferase/IMP cyclohydrolase
MAQRRALLSVYDKTGIVDFARALVELGFEVVSTGGTYRVITAAGVDATYVSDVTASPEVFGGRVKTLHPVVHGGILFRRGDAEHAAEAAANGIVPIDVVAVNLYPFVDTIAKPGVTMPEAVEQIDIGGPTMVRAAAKNFVDVTIVVSPADYGDVAQKLRAGEIDLPTRQRLSLKAFEHTAGYDAAIATYLAQQLDTPALAAERHSPLHKVTDLRYGENPHQSAALYRSASETDYSGATVLQGKALSYNNIVDLDGAVAAVREFQEPAAVVVKHTNPCGVGRDGASLLVAYEHALAADPISAFGGIVSLNRVVDATLATLIAGRFYEVVSAPDFSEEAREIFARKSKLRLLVVPERAAEPVVLRQTMFGTLAQTADPRINDLDETWTVATERVPTDAEAAALAFLWRVCKHVKSNAIVLGDETSTSGIGAGQMSRVDAVKLAVTKATRPVLGASLASDAFFPFRDGVDHAADAGVKAIIQPGGSMRDQEVIDACNERGIAMVFTGHRHFKH